MLPAVISREIEEGIKSFLRTTFPPSTPAFENTLDEFLDAPGQVFKGPYYSLRLPFRPAPAAPLPFREITFPYPPHLHQARALTRLCGDLQRSTLVATGTGSGKTECFLYPILDHCAAHLGEGGIKAIIIYPMNALATDQAKRVAEAIWNEDKLRGKVTAGLFIGDEGEQSVTMTETSLITDKAKMRDQPPDILLTNYKMLDYLLLRPSEQGLWQGKKPETLRYLVVDELHTFDGAQATDLACLIRRLKARLRTPAGCLTCVGTSATLGGDPAPLVEYAGKVFAESFEAESVISEDLLALADVVAGHFIKFHRVPASAEIADSAMGGTPEEYLSAQQRLWFGEDAGLASPEDRLALGTRLREHSFFRNLLTLTGQADRKIFAEDWLAHNVGQMLGSEMNPDEARRVLDSFLSLCAHARFAQGGRSVPLLRVHAHLWMRELSRLVASVGQTPKLTFSDDLKNGAELQYLPALHCRDCGAMGWGGTMRATEDKVSTDLTKFYEAFFRALPSLRFFFPVSGRDGNGPEQGEFTHTLCTHCLGVNAANARKCVRCGADTERLLSVLMSDRTRRADGQTEADRACPFCASSSGLTILGSRAASLTSVALSQLYTSPFNHEKKALAFSDNVQDASHRAGFFAARTYRVNLRTAIRRALEGFETEPRLVELEEGFIRYWKETLGEPGFVALFLAPSMEWLDDFDSLCREGKLPQGSDLVRLVERRASWEVAAEFGFNSRIGRTLEKSSAAIAHVDAQALADASRLLVTRLREKAGGFGVLAESDRLTLLAGVLRRLRTGGGIFHAEIESYVESGGNTFLLNKTVHMPHFGPRSEQPVFFTMGPERLGRFERLVAGGTNLSWSQRWAIKALRSVPGLSAESSGIVVKEAVRALTECGLLTERQAKGNRVWGLARERLRIAREVCTLKCGRCSHLSSCAPVELAAWDGAPCLRSNCHGRYAAQPTETDYYGDLYRRGDVIRIRAAEHTGLLDRKVREWIETRFMAAGEERRGTDPNLLSCTPTLEMGVNIGDLASVVLCAIPPATSNYVQRVGRAGRKEGVAVTRVKRVSDIDIHPLIQSELEKKFLEALRHEPGAQLQPKIVRGKPGYLWRRGDVAWELALQVAVAVGAEAAVASTPDFVLYPVRTGASRPVAVFLDGFAFHADEAAGHNRIAKDVHQRQALVQSGAFWVWSFSWEDIDSTPRKHNLMAVDSLMRISDNKHVVCSRGHDETHQPEGFAAKILCLVNDH